MMVSRSRTWCWRVVATLLLLAAGPAAFSQQSTERFIPIGASPGISGRYSYVGKIVDITDRRTVTVEETGGERHAITITADTQIWLDRSRRRLTNTVGDYSDCQVGRRVEIMYRRDDPSIAVWIKLADE